MKNTAPAAEVPSARFDAQLRASLGAVAAAGAVLSLCAVAFVGPGAAISVGFGAALATANFWALARTVTALLPDPRSGPDAQSRAAERAAGNRGAWALVALLKTFGLLAVTWLLMRHGIASPLPMLVGFGALPMGIAIGSLVSNRGASGRDD